MGMWSILTALRFSGHCHHATTTIMITAMRITAVTMQCCMRWC